MPEWESKSSPERHHAGAAKTVVNPCLVRFKCNVYSWFLQSATALTDEILIVFVLLSISNRPHCCDWV
jgi:hypothetical protein